MQHILTQALVAFPLPLPQETMTSPDLFQSYGIASIVHVLRERIIDISVQSDKLKLNVSDNATIPMLLAHAQVALSVGAIVDLAGLPFQEYLRALEDIHGKNLSKSDTQLRTKSFMYGMRAAYEKSNGHSRSLAKFSEEFNHLPDYDFNNLILGPVFWNQLGILRLSYHWRISQTGTNAPIISRWDPPNLIIG